MTQNATSAIPHSVYDPNRLLNTIRQHLKLESDSALSRKLKIAANVIKNIRAGSVPVCGSMLLWMQEATGIGIDELRRLLGDRRATFRLRYSLSARAAS